MILDSISSCLYTILITGQEDTSWNRNTSTISMLSMLSSYAMVINLLCLTWHSALASHVRKSVIAMIVSTLSMSLAKHLSIKNTINVVTNFLNLFPLLYRWRGREPERTKENYLLRSVDTGRTMAILKYSILRQYHLMLQRVHPLSL